MTVEKVHYLGLKVLVEVGLFLGFSGLCQAEGSEVDEDAEVIVTYAWLFCILYEFLHLIYYKNEGVSFEKWQVSQSQIPYLTKGQEQDFQGGK